MEVVADILSLVAGVPAIVGLALTAAAIFLTSDWRLSLTSLLVQYMLVGLALTRSIQAEVALVKVLVGVMVVSMLYLSARRIQDMQGVQKVREEEGVHFLGMHVAWGSGPLGLPARLLAVFLVALAVFRFAGDFRSLLPVLDVDSPSIPSDVALVSFWLAGVGLLGLVLSGDPLRAAAAVLTVLAGFELIYAGLEPNLAIVGFWEAFVLLAALAFSYLIIVKGLTPVPHQEEVPAGPSAEALPEAAGQDGGDAES